VYLPTVTTPNQPTTDHPIDLAAAAAMLGISREAVRLRIRRGTLRAQRRPAGWVVWLDGSTLGGLGRTGQPATDRGDRPTGDRPSRSRRERELLDRIAWLEARVEESEAERHRWQMMLMAEQQTVSALRARLAPPAEEPVAEPPHTRGRARTPWWVFWRRRA
jgi:hypothetical protein